MAAPPISTLKFISWGGMLGERRELRLDDDMEHSLAGVRFGNVGVVPRKA